MEKKIFVGGLAYNTTEDALRDHLSQAGEVTSVKIIYDRETNRSRGFAFAEFASEDDAKKAIEMFNEQEFEGRKLHVNEAREPAPRRNFREE